MGVAASDTCDDVPQTKRCGKARDRFDQNVIYAALLLTTEGYTAIVRQ
jgi:hypothetical protein